MCSYKSPGTHSLSQVLYNMIPIEKLKQNYHLKEIELNALLEITHAINSNMQEEDLYKIFHFTLRTNFQLKKLALYVQEKKWVCKVHFGTNIDFASTILDKKLLQLNSPTPLSLKQNIAPFNQFDTLIPVLHEKKLLALVFIEREGEKAVYQDVNFIQILSNIVMVAIANKRLVKKQLKQAAIAKELAIAAKVQKLLFPSVLPQEKNLCIKASYVPHREVGGDYYHYIPIDKHRFLICTADVSGKGVPAAILMSNFQATLSTLIKKTDQLKEIIQDLNEQVNNIAHGNHYITLFLAIYDKIAHQLRYINAGHVPPFMIKDQQPIQALKQGTTILGIFRPLPFLEESIIYDLKKFCLFAYTDGLTEVNNKKGLFFGAKRLKAFLEQNKHLSITQLHTALLRTLEEFREKEATTDDITFLICKAFF